MNGPLIGSIQGTAIGKTLSTDVFGPFPYNKDSDLSESISLLTITDVISRYTIVRVIKDYRSPTLSKIIKKEWFDQSGIPESILSDNGTNYIGKPFKQFLKSNNIKHHYSSLYNQRGNSVSERLNQTLGNVLRINRGKAIH